MTIKTSKLEELKTLIAGRDETIHAANKGVNELILEIEKAQNDYSLAVSEGDVSQASKGRRLKTLRQKYEDALFNVESLKNASMQSRQSEKLAVLCDEVEAEARSEIERLDKEKVGYTEALEKLKAQVIENGMAILDLEQQQQAIRSDVTATIKAVKGRKYSPSLPGPGHFVNHELIFRDVIASAWQEQRGPKRKERSPIKDLQPNIILLNQHW